MSSLAREFSRCGHDAVVARSAGAARALRPGDILHFHFSGWLRPWHAPLLLGLPRGSRLAVTFQDYGHPDLPPLRSRDRAALARLLRGARFVTAVSRFIAGAVSRDFPGVARRLRVVHNGADPAQQGGADGGRPYIITVGRPAPYKGLDLLLFAYAEAAAAGCGADLLVCGTAAPPLRRLAAELGISGRVRFAGRVAPARLAGLLRGSLFFATAPRWESFGMAALEAMAAGKAVVAPRAGGLTEFAAHGRNALLFPAGDTAAAASAMIRLCRSSALRERLGRAGRHTAARLSWGRAAAGYLRVFGEEAER